MTIGSFGLENKCAIITGGARGIGFATAQTLLQSGAVVTLWDVDPEALVDARSELSVFGQVLTKCLDISNYEEVHSSAKNAFEEMSRIDILVNNAGISGPNMMLKDYPIDVWDKVIAIDLKGPFLCCREVLPFMMKNDYGRIINVSSVAGKEGNPMVCAYSTAKAGLIGLTKSLGKELAQTGIRVNAITPATVGTDILKQLTQEQIDYMVSRIPIGRMGTVEENANMIAWLCTEECSFSTGAVFDTSGGRCTY